MRRDLGNRGSVSLDAAKVGMISFISFVKVKYLRFGSNFGSKIYETPVFRLKVEGKNLLKFGNFPVLESSWR